LEIRSKDQYTLCLHLTRPEADGSRTTGLTGLPRANHLLVFHQLTRHDWGVRNKYHTKP